MERTTSEGFPPGDRCPASVRVPRRGLGVGMNRVVSLFQARTKRTEEMKDRIAWVVSGRWRDSDRWFFQACVRCCV